MSFLRRTPPFRAVVLILAALATGCGGDSGTDPDPTPTPTPTITVSVSPSSVSLEQADEVTVTITLTRGGGYTGSVTLTFSGLPTGVAAAAASIGAGSNQAVVALTATAAAAVGSATVGVTAAGSGVAAAQASFALAVTAAPVGSFAVDVDPATLSLEQGEAGTVDVNLDRSGGFAGPVDLEIAGAPAGMTATLAETRLAGTATTLDVSVGGSVAPGDYPLVLTAAGDGTDDRTATLTVTVTAAGVDVAWDICEGGPPPFFVAVQDGDGPWTPVTPQGGLFSFRITADRGGVAYLVEADDDVTALYTVFLAREEFATSQPLFLADNCTIGSKTVFVDVSPDLVAPEYAAAALGGLTSSSITTGPLTLDVDEVPEGMVDLIGSRGRITGPGVPTVERLYVERGLEPADGATIPMNFAGPFGFDPVDATVSVAGAGGDATVLTVHLDTGSTVGELLEALITGSTPVTVPLVPDDRLVEGDLLAFRASTFDGSSAPGTGFREVSRYVTTGGDQTLTFGPDLVGATLDAVPGGSTVRGRARYTSQPEYGDYWFAAFEQTVGLESLGHIVVVSSAWAGGSDLEIAVPDLTAVTGWNSDWEFQPGLTVRSLFAAYGWTGEGFRGPFSLFGTSAGDLFGAAIWGEFVP